MPNGLEIQRNYYVVASATDSIELSLTSGGAAVTLSASDGSGDQFAGLVEGALISAMLLLIGSLWENREQEITGTITTELKLGMQRLLMPYTHVRF